MRWVLPVSSRTARLGIPPVGSPTRRNIIVADARFSQRFRSRAHLTLEHEGRPWVSCARDGRTSAIAMSSSRSGLAATVDRDRNDAAMPIGR
jgi:hypothetical protein